MDANEQCRKQERKISKKDAIRISSDFFNHSLDMINAAKLLRENGDVFQIFPAAFLAHLGLELLLKACILKSKNLLCYSHDLNSLFEAAPFSKKGFANNDRDAISEFTKYHRLRYSDKPWNLKGVDSSDMHGIDLKDFDAAIALYCRIREKISK